jgi:transposase
MAKPLVPDELWAIVEPLLPPHPPRPHGGRRPVDDRACFTGILFVLKTGIAWEDLPQEMGCGSGMTCWRRLVAWHKVGVFERLHEELLARLRAEGLRDTDYAVIDSGSVRAVFGGAEDRAQPHGPGQSGHEAPPYYGRPWGPAGHNGYSGQPP